MLSAAYCPLHAACCLDVVCCILHVVCRIFPCCMSSVAFSPLHVACCQLSVAHFPVVVCGIDVSWIVSACPFFAACRTFSVACGRISVACCPPHCPLSHGVRGLSPAPRRISSRCTLQDARSLSHVVSCPSPVPSCTLSVACRLLPVAEGLRAVVLAGHRGGACNLGRSDRRGPLQCRPRCACVRAGVNVRTQA